MPVSNTTVAKRQISSLVKGLTGSTGYATESAQADGAFPSMLSAFCTVQYADTAIEVSPRSLHANDEFDDEIDNLSREATRKADADGLVLESESGRSVITEVWTAEDDGSISIRDPATGRHVKRESNRCVQFPRTFGTCMRQVEGFVVVGYQDGNIRIFDAASRQVICSKKKHAAAVTSLVVWKHGSKEQSDAEDSYVLFCASEDFRISMWSLNTSGDATFVHHLAGHSSRVECLAVEGDFLFSGGADGFVRCWDIHLRSEVKSTESGEGGYPLLAHSNVVKDICVVEEVLITAGTGGVCLWDMETCAPIHQFDDFGVGTDINKVCVNPASLVLWACSSQGTIHLFDLYRFQPIGTMSDFGAANIKQLAPVAQGATSRAFFTVAGEGLTCVYSENSDTGMTRLVGDDSLSTVIKAEFETIDSLREQIVANSKLLFEQRSHLWWMRRTDEYRKETSAQWLCKSSTSDSLRREFLERTQLFLLKTRYRQRQLYLATRLAVDNNRRLLFTMWLKWSHARRGSKDAFFRDYVTNVVTDSTHQQLVAKHLHNAITYLEQTEERKRLEATAVVFERNNHRSLLRGYFFGWVRLGEQARRLDKRAEALRAVLRASNSTLMRQNFAVLLRNVHNNRRERVKLHAGNTLMRFSERFLSRTYFMKLLSFRREKRFLAQRSVLACQLQRLLTQNTLKEAFFALVSFTNQRREAKGVAAISNIQKEIGEMGAAIAAAPGDDVTEAELDAQIADQDAEIARLEEQLKTELACVEWLEKRNARLQALEGPEEAAAKGSDESSGAAEPGPEKPIESFTAFAEEKLAEGTPSSFQECCAVISVFKFTGCLTTRDIDLFAATSDLLPVAASDVKAPSVSKAKAPVRASSKVPTRPVGKAAPKLSKPIKKADDKPRRADSVVKVALDLFNRSVDRVRDHFEESFPADEGKDGAWRISLEAIKEAPRTVLKRTLSGVREAIVLWDAVYSLWSAEKLRNGLDDSADHDLYIPGASQLRANLQTIKAALDREMVLGAEQASVEPPKATKRASSADELTSSRLTAKAPVGKSIAKAPAAARLTAAKTRPASVTAAKKPAAKASTKPALAK